MDKIIALANLNSGSVPKDGADALQLILAELGHRADVMPFTNGDLRKQLDAAIARAPDCLIVWGGDGSVNCAFSACGPSGPPVLALPGGTMNLIHQRLHHDHTDWQDILRSALISPNIEPWAGGEVNGEPFYVAVMAGRLTALSESRELVRKGAILEAIGAAATNQVFDMQTRLRIGVLNAGQTVFTDATAGAIVLAGDRRPRFDVAAIDPDGGAGLISVALQSLFKGWRDSDDVTVEPATHVMLQDVNGEPVPATLDGEPCELPPESEIRLVPNAVRVIRAKPSV